MANKLFYQLNTYLGRDPAVSRITLDLDTACWSTRKRNIITRAIEKNLADCGHEMAWLIQSLMDAFNCGTIVNVSGWRGTLETNSVKPELLDELTAYTAAWVRLATAGEKNGKRVGNYHLLQFLKLIDNKAALTYLPLPKMGKKARTEFLAKYVVEPHPALVEKRQRLVSAIKGGELITITLNK